MALLADLMAINREFLEELKLREGEKFSAVSSQPSDRLEPQKTADR